MYIHSCWVSKKDNYRPFTKENGNDKAVNGMVIEGGDSLHEGLVLFIEVDTVYIGPLELSSLLLQLELCTIQQIPLVIQGAGRRKKLFT